jgi:aryl-alcohol dehydrogenase (NADP+)
MEQLEDNLGSVEVHLDDEEVAELDRASDLRATDYPYGSLALDQRGRELAGT